MWKWLAKKLIPLLVPIIREIVETLLLELLKKQEDDWATGETVRRLRKDLEDGKA